MSIERRVAKLEQRTIAMGDADRVPGLPDEMMQQIHRVAAVVGTPAELEAYVRTLEGPAYDDVVSLDDRRRSDAVRAALARTIFEEVRHR